MSLRDKYKNNVTPVASLKKAKEADEAITGGGRGDSVKIKDGLNKLRFFPMHDGEESYKKLYCHHWVKIEGDDGEPTPRSMPNSKVHGNTPKDIIDEYMAFVRKMLGDGDADDADDAAKIKLLTSREKGIGMKNSYLSYVKKIIGPEAEGNFERGLCEFKKTVSIALDDAAIIEDADAAADNDPYTHIDDGVPVLITYNSKAKKAADYYKTQITKKASPLSDDDLEWFDKQTPLSQLFKFRYGRKEFETALEGVRYFDESNDINLFDTEEFQAIITEVSGYYSRDTDDEDSSAKKPAAKSSAKAATKAKPAAKPAKPIPEPEEEEEQDDLVDGGEEEEDSAEVDQFENMDREEMKAFKAANEITDFKVFKTTTDDEIREKLREWQAAQEDQPAFEAEEEEEDTTAKATAGKPNLDSIKKKLNIGGKK